LTSKLLAKNQEKLIETSQKIPRIKIEFCSNLLKNVSFSKYQTKCSLNTKLIKLFFTLNQSLLSNKHKINCL
jgi:hypothetical protein